MTQYIAFVRAINVGGRAVIRMTDLRDAFDAAGCNFVRTYIQSGNVFFASPDADPSKLFEKIRKRLATLVGGQPGISFRTVSEIERLVKANPFRELDGDPLVKLYVAFLEAKPKVKPKFPVTNQKEALEALAMKNLDVFITSRRKPSGFYGFPNNFIEKELGVPATTRNWTTVMKMWRFVSDEN